MPLPRKSFRKSTDMKQEIISSLCAECPWGDTLHWFDTIDSTNTRAKSMAAEGAPQGTVLVAGHQTAGRGRMGRSFSSPDGMGVYMSVILRPNCSAEKLMHLTCAVAVAMCDAVEAVSGLRPGIKWINDLVVGKKKLGGILTELSVIPGTNRVAYAIIGIGINCLQKPQDFPPELQEMAISLSEAAGKDISPAALAAAMVQALWNMEQHLLTDSRAILAIYEKDCITLGKAILVVRGDDSRHGAALSLTSDGGLLVRYEDGTTEVVQSGEVSIRGMYGYL